MMLSYVFAIMIRREFHCSEVLSHSLFKSGIPPLTASKTERVLVLLAEMGRIPLPNATWGHLTGAFDEKG